MENKLYSEIENAIISWSNDHHEPARYLTEQIIELLNKESYNTEIINSLSTALINRVEVIDTDGRSYVNWDQENNVKMQLQDLGKTLKVFITIKE